VRTKPYKIIPTLVVIAVAMGVYWYSSSTITLSDVQRPERQYKNITRGFTLNYPESLSFKEYDEGGGTYTIVFEDEAGEKGFQIFFTPYSEDTITESRILKDVPSGEFSEPTEVVLGDGTHALVFFSNGSFGELREVWFVKDGFLYEVTTYKDLDTWLDEIMKTWKFIE